MTLFKYHIVEGQLLNNAFSNVNILVA